MKISCHSVAHCFVVSKRSNILTLPLPTFQHYEANTHLVMRVPFAQSLARIQFPNNFDLVVFIHLWRLSVIRIGSAEKWFFSLRYGFKRSKSCVFCSIPLNQESSAYQAVLCNILLAGKHSSPSCGVLVVLSWSAFWKTNTVEKQLPEIRLFCSIWPQIFTI